MFTPQAGHNALRVHSTPDPDLPDPKPGPLPDDVPPPVNAPVEEPRVTPPPIKAA
ncbi:MAG: hypothetical protein V4631_00155 [Pseudomonadota bacterium]